MYHCKLVFFSGPIKNRSSIMVRRSTGLRCACRYLAFPSCAWSALSSSERSGKAPPPRRLDPMVSCPSSGTEELGIETLRSRILWKTHGIPWLHCIILYIKSCELEVCFETKVLWPCHFMSPCCLYLGLCWQLRFKV